MRLGVPMELYPGRAFSRETAHPADAQVGTLSGGRRQRIWSRAGQGEPERPFKEDPRYADLQPIEPWQDAPAPAARAIASFLRPPGRSNRGHTLKHSSQPRRRPPARWSRTPGISSHQYGVVFASMM